MPTENNWMYCNLDKRITDPFIDFKVSFNPTPFKKISFEQASIESANKIANKYDNIFISLSGGLDSEYIMLTLYNLKIPFKPIIVVADKANELEVQYAFHMCKKINIEPKVINCSEFEFFNIFKYSIFNKMNGKGIYTTPIIITGKYVEEQNGVLLTGEHIIDDDKFITKASINDWDFYQDHLLNISSVGLLNYTPEIAYAIVNAFDGSETQEFKSKLYNLSFRPKMHPIFSADFMKSIKQLFSSRKIPKYSEVLGNKEEFLNMMDSWNI